MILMVTMPISALYLIIFHTLKIWEYTLCIIVAVIFLWIIFKCVSYRIVLYNDYVYVNNDALFKFNRVQFKTSIKYDDIADIQLDFSTTNSHKKTIRGQIAVNKYLVFTLQNGRHKRICVNMFSKKQVLKLSQEIAIRSNIKLSEKLIEDVNKYRL
ncbi:MAG: hypothetical protein IJ371_06045 [Clostridia bacterium]|nr:hypothetical protein [Clostridia bacterium]